MSRIILKVPCSSHGIIYPFSVSLVFSPIGFLQPAPSDEAKQGAFVAILPLMSAHVPSLIWEIQVKDYVRFVYL